jgi:hypothetical protein
MHSMQKESEGELKKLFEKIKIETNTILSEKKKYDSIDKKILRINEKNLLKNEKIKKIRIQIRDSKILFNEKMREINENYHQSDKENASESESDHGRSPFMSRFVYMHICLYDYMYVYVFTYKCIYIFI